MDPVSLCPGAVVMCRVILWTVSSMLRTRNTTRWILAVCLVCAAARSPVATAQIDEFRQELPFEFTSEFATGLLLETEAEANRRQTDSGDLPQIDLDVPVGDEADQDGAEKARRDVGDDDGQDDSTDLASRVQALEAEVASLTATGDDAAENSLDFRLSSLEDTLSEFEGSSGAKFVETLSRNSRRIFNGRIHLDTWNFPNASSGINAIENGDFALDPENRTLVRRARLGVRGTVRPDNISYRLDMEFSGVDGGQIRDAWLGWDELPCLNTLRVGNQKRPYGLDHLNSSNFMTFLERPMIVDAVNRENRRVGIMTYGSSHNSARNWQVGVFNMVTIQDNNQIVGDVAQVEVAGRLANTVWYDERSNGRGYAHLGFAGTLAFPGGAMDENQAFFQTRPEGRTASQWLDTGVIDGAHAYQLLALESVVNVGSLQFTGEWMHIWMQRETARSLGMHGGYLSVSYFLTGEHVPWDRNIGILGRVSPHENFFCLDTCDGRRGRGLGAWQVAARLSQADFNDHDILGGIGKSVTLALNWYMNANTRWQFNYLIGRVDNRRTTLTGGAMPVVSGSYSIIGTRFVIDF